MAHQMKRVSLFDLGYLDLFKAIFLGKKIRLVPDTRVVEGTRGAVVRKNPDLADTGTAVRDDFTNDFYFYWGAGRNGLDPYHLNPFTPNPFDRH